MPFTVVEIRRFEPAYRPIFQFIWVYIPIQQGINMKEYTATREQLTNQSLRGLFKSNFELANHAILLALFYIKSGHEVTMAKLLNEIKRNPSEQYLKDLQKMEEEEEETVEKV
jgi:hypothetical protein